ncbi:hypothetical protein [Candidatus Neomicrothrix sp.]|uniref:hypothetical protein n=1 Tax=Candidatus Neomicrothrix sp. TaxID=2719034 RepID=UPI0025941C09|nr:hypothetical protein [Candidatus Microthrix sp.]HMS48329.1 hypothetical protein [Candidatus Microthrix sp.]
MNTSSLIGLLIAEELQDAFFNRLEQLDNPNGLVLESGSELRLVLDALFTHSPVRLDATSVGNKYWEDDELRFKEHNWALLRGRGKVRRLFYTSDLANLISEEWLSDLLDQVAEGAEVRLAEAGQDDQVPRDFGLYYFSDAKERALLTAPPGPVDSNPIAITVDATSFEHHERLFSAAWNGAGDCVTVERRRDNGAAQQAEVFDEEISVASLLDNRIILRQMRRLFGYDGVQPGLPRSGFSRKFEMAYAEVVSEHLKADTEFKSRPHLVYVGDTAINDGGAMRNLQRLNWDLDGFISDRDVVGCFTVGGITYGDRWDDLVSFAQRLGDTVDENTVLIMDIDQTIWGPKKVQEQPLHESRLLGIMDLVTSIAGGDERFNDRVRSIYDRTAARRLHPLAQDDEDRKAALTALLSLGVWPRPDIESYRSNDRPDFLDALAPSDFGDRGEQYLVAFTETHKDIRDFTARAFSYMMSETYRNWFHDSLPDGNYEEFASMVDGLYDASAAQRAVLFPAFRRRELRALLALAKGREPGRALVANAAVVDFVRWCKARGAVTLGLSDRPDECTYNDSEDLLQVPLQLCGTRISSRLPQG